MWRTDSRVERQEPVSFVQALKHEANCSGMATFESFNRFADFEGVFVKACDRAARSAFGHRFIEFERFGRPDDIFLKGVDSRTVTVHCDLRIRYGGLLDFLREAGVFNTVLAKFRKEFENYLSDHYSDTKLILAHSGTYKRVLNLKVKVQLKSMFE